MQKCGFAGAGFSHQSQHFAALDIQREAGENHQAGVARAVDFGEVAGANEGLRHPTVTITQVRGGPEIFSGKCGRSCSAPPQTRGALALRQGDTAWLLPRADGTSWSRGRQNYPHLVIKAIKDRCKDRCKAADAATAGL